MRVPVGLFVTVSLMSAETAGYQIRTSKQSTFALDVYKTGLWSGRKHVFFFERYRGEMRYDPEKPENSRVRFVVESASLVCRDAWVKDSDKKKVVAYALDEMMAARQYPELVFVSTRIVGKSQNHFEARGELTVRDITRPATVEVAVQQAGDRLELDGTAAIRMKDYGLKPPSAALGTIGTRNEMLVHFVLWAEKAK